MESQHKYVPHAQVSPKHYSTSYHPSYNPSYNPYNVDQVVVQENINITDYEHPHHHAHHAHHAAPVVRRGYTDVAMILVLFILLVIILRARNAIL